MFAGKKSMPRQQQKWHACCLSAMRGKDEEKVKTDHKTRPKETSFKAQE